MKAEDGRASEAIDRYFAVSPDLVCRIGMDGRFQRSNPAFEHLLGYSGEDVLTKRITDLAHAGDRDLVQTRLASLANGTQHARFEAQCQHADGSYRWLEWDVVSFAERGFLYATARDVTDLKARQLELMRAKQEAERANRTRGEFLANVSHEIRTPMNGIIGMTELALDTPLTDQQREYLQMVQGSALALLDVINSVLDFSKIEAGKVEIETIDFTLRDTLTGALKPQALIANRKGIELLYEEGPGIPERLRGDPGRLRQILVNLIGNAVKFTEQGEVHVTVQKVEDLGGGARLTFEVRDTGIGIPAEKLDTIFDAFSQVDGSTSRRFGGTGLGLSIAASLVELMGGAIAVESEEGVGSVFRFSLPFEVAQQAARPPLFPSTELRGLRVLVLDDNPTNRRIMEGFVRRMDMEPVSASTGMQAIETLLAAHADGNPLDLAILDVHMPIMDGFEVARRIREDARFDDLVLLTITSAGRPGDGALCERLRISSYLLKPITPTELRDAIQLTLARGHETPGEAALVTRHSLREAWGSLRVLLAEDNQVNQRLAVHLLERLGHKVQVARSGVEAVRLFETTTFDLVLMDIQMPEMDGEEATRRIRAIEAERGGRVPIVAMTAHAMKGDRERFLRAGMDEYISKPVSQERLREVVRTFGSRSNEVRADRGTPPPAPAPVSSAEATFDGGALLARVDSDKELLGSLVAVFKADRLSLMAGIEEAIAAKDAVALADTAHTLKGALSVFGVEPARSTAEELEMAGKDKRLQNAGELYERLDREVVAAEKGLETFLAEVS